MGLNTDHLLNCILTLQSALEHLQKTPVDTIEYDVFRNATIKGFELTLETAGKLLRKALKFYSGDPSSIDELTFKNVLRQANKHKLLSNDEVERWFAYRDNRNTTAHDYGKAFAEQTLKLLPEFIKDARNLQQKLQETFGQKDA